MLQNKKALIFDIDGSLVDSMWIWKQIDIEYLAKFDIILPENLQSEIEGMSFNETATYFKNRFHIEDSVEKIKKDWNDMAWDKYANEVKLKKGALNLLKYCKENEILMGIGSSNSKELVTHLINALNISDYFSAIVTGCDIEKGKPSPDIYLKVSELLKVSPSQCLVFEDIIPGIKAGLAAGMHVCAVEDAYSLHQTEEKKMLAHYYIQEFDEVMK
jgi:HAD superfamily hydrolase (TIGR01509 family)